MNSKVAVVSLLTVMFLLPAAGALSSVGPIEPSGTAAVPMGAPGATGAAGAADGVLPPLRMPFHHPLLNADPEVWVPILAEGGSMSEAVEAAMAAADLYYDLYPLGDTNGDGLADYVLETTAVTEEEPVEWCEEEEDPLGGGYCFETWSTTYEVTLQAIAGGSYQPLWSLTLPSEAWWYPIGDVDRDGFDDLMIESYEEGSEDGVGQGVLVAGAYRGESSEIVHYDIVSGATGQSLYAADAPFTLTYTMATAWPVVGGVALYDYEMTITIVEPVREGPAGVDVLTLRGRDVTTYAFLPAAFTYASYETTAVSVERQDLAGKAKWSAEVKDDLVPLVPVDNRDYTGDGVADLLFGAYGNGAEAYTEVPVPPLAQPIVVLLDGTNGAEAWRHEGEPFMGEVLTTAAGKVRGPQRDVALHAVEATPTGGYASETITFLDGESGAVVGEATSTTELMIAGEFADATGDGKDEMFLVTMPMPSASLLGGEEYYEESFTYGVADAKLKYLWSAEATEDAYLPVFDSLEGGGMSEEADFDGDGVPDLLRYTGWGCCYFGRDEGPTPTTDALSGATGEQLWSVPMEDDVFEFAPVGDVDGDGGDDLARVRWQVPSGGEADEFNHYPGHLDLLRGSDAASFWSKLVFHPDAFPNATGEWIMVHAVNAGDVDGNGIADVLLSMNAEGDGCCGGGVIIMESDDFATRSPNSRSSEIGDEEETGEPFRLALVVEGATAATLMSYPEAPIPDKDAIVAGPASIAVETTEEADGERGLLPGFEVALLALALAAAVVVRRRRA